MKKYLNFKPIFLALVTSLTLWSCNNDDDGIIESNDSIADIAIGSPNLSNLVAALERADLVTTLQGSGSFTVLAPTNAAFDTFLATAGFASIDDVPVDVLRQILLNHVVGSRIESATLIALGKNYTETLADGPTAGTNLALYFDASGAGVEFNGVSDVIDADIPASNGVIHTVNAVIDLPTVVTFVTADDNFEQLTTALTTATPGTNFADILSGTGPFTVFAPADTAFDALLDSNPAWNTVNDIEEGLLTSVLLHHVLNGNVRSTDITDDSTAPTLEGDNLTFSTADGGVAITDGAGNDGADVVVADIQAKNGVIHLVDQVLLPDTNN